MARLDALMSGAWDHRLTLVVAPAGSGKSTLLARFATHAASVVAWYRAEGWDREPARMLRHMEAAFGAVMPGLRGGWETADDAAAALESAPPGRCLLVVDDLHALESTPAERSLERFIELAPASLTIVAASRVRPDMNLPRLKVAGKLLEIGADDLRFRAWEVERLFRDFYGEMLPPEELAVLARRTEGWAAGLQLFHLATRGKPPADRRRLLDGLARPASRLVRDYLSRNVLADLRDELRSFLVGTAVLGRLTATLCDQILGRTGSAAILDELEARSLFTFPLPEPGAYRYHEVFRAHLQGALVDACGEVEARRLHHRAGELLASAGALPEALDAYCRAGSWDAVDTLLGRDGASLADRSTARMAAVPPAMLRHDPWLILARARALRAEGRLRDAVEAYAAAEAAFGSADGGLLASHERTLLSPWLEVSPPPRQGPSALLRIATIREPEAVRRTLATQLDGASRLVEGLALLLAGQVSRAHEMLHALADSTEGSTVVTIAAGLGAGAARLLAGDAAGASEVRGAIVAAEQEGLEWLERMGRACLELADRDDRDATLVAETASGAGDTWGAALALLLGGWAGGGEPADRRDRLEAAAAAFRTLGAPVLETWSLALYALCLATAGEPDAERAALTAEAMARTTGIATARGLAYLALARSRGDASGELERDAEATVGEAGLGIPWWALEDVAPDFAPDQRPPTGRMELRCLGVLELALDGVPVDLTAARPRVRALLRLLASQPDTAIHQEVICEAFWPEADPESGAQNLHAAMAALRRLVEPRAGRGNFQLVVRQGNTYRLVVPPGSQVDLIEFDRALAIGRAARAAGNAPTAELAYAQALSLYRGELLADEGPATWLVEPRERRRGEAVEAVQAVAEALADRHELEAAARVCADGLRIDRYHDPLWRLLIAIRERAGDAIAAQRARQGYGRILVELGVRDDP